MNSSTAADSTSIPILKSSRDKRERDPSSGFGMFGGVFTPCTLTILGVIMFLRFGYVVGNAGLVVGAGNPVDGQSHHRADDVVAVGDRNQHPRQRRRCLFSDQPQSGRRIWRRDRSGFLSGTSHFGGHVRDWIHGGIGCVDGRRDSIQSCRRDHEPGCVCLRVYRRRLDDQSSVLHPGDAGGCRWFRFSGAALAISVGRPFLKTCRLTLWTRKACSRCSRCSFPQ